MSTTWVFNPLTGRREEVTLANPFPVRIPDDLGTNRTLPPVAGRSFFTPPRTVPGIGTGAAYADGDIMGTVIEFPNVFRPERLSGILLGGIYYDLDDEGLQVDLHLSARPFATSPGADNAAFTVLDADLLAIRATCTFATTAFFNFANNQIAYDFRTQPIFSDSTSLWGYVVARGALNIAAGNLPAFSLCLLPD